MDKAAQQKWDAWAASHSNLFESVERSPDPEAMEVILDDIATKLALAEGDRLLDVGCGSGVVCTELGRRHKLEVAGVDFAHAQVKLGIEHFPRTAFAQAAAESVPFVEGSFGKLLCYGVFHYVDDWRGAIADFARVVAPGGRILIGDLPSKAHRHRLYLGYVKRLPVILKNLKTLFSKVDYARQTSHWHWIDVKAMRRHAESLGHEARIVPQPRGHRQYGGETHTYRFDLLIEVK
jgi:ubiquinone/menaquinone biosynthesis C-methylase UbiE